MSSTVQIIPGPSITEVTRARAEAGLKQIASRRQASTYTMDEVDGNWVGALVFETATKVSDGNPFGGGGEEEAPSPDPSAGAPSDGGDDDSGPDGPPSPDSGSDGPPSEGDDKGEKKEKGKGGEIKEVLDALHQIADALGVPLATGDNSMVPGADDGMGGPPGPPGGPAGPPMGGPAGPPPMGGPPGMADKFPKPMHPGDTPPGGTPVGAPAFASVRPNHPWAHVAGKLAHFRASTAIGEQQPIHEVTSSISELAREIGYTAKVRESRDDNGNRIAVALLSAN
jgi:hypothetical protein